MAIITQISAEEKFKVSLDLESGLVTVFNLVKETSYKDYVLQEDIEKVQAMLVPGFGYGDVLYAIGYYIAKKVGAGSDAK